MPVSPFLARNILPACCHRGNFAIMNRFFFEIEVDTGDRLRLFNFCIMDNDYDITCKLYADGKEARIDRDLFLLSGNMPGSWIAPAIEKLLTLLNQP